jgi:hypothetical protein
VGRNNGLIVVVYNDMRKAIVNNCRMKSKDVCGWRRILEEATV